MYFVVTEARERSKCRPAELLEIDGPDEIDDLHLDLSGVSAAAWVTLYQPEKAAPGFNLAFYRRRVPIIIDMNGHIVHSWPMVRAVGRVRLNSDGSLVAIGTDNLVKEYDWDGNLTWFFQLPDKHHFPHHDLIRLDNGNYLILAQDEHSSTDYLYEVDRNKEVQWEWWFEDHIERLPRLGPWQQRPLPLELDSGTAAQSLVRQGRRTIPPRQHPGQRPQPQHDLHH